MNISAASLTCRPLPRSWGGRRLGYMTATGVVEVTGYLYLLLSASKLAVCIHMGLMHYTTSSVEIC
jgi:hypothetical protein